MGPNAVLVKFFSFIFCSLTFIGFLYQVGQTSISFFKFSVKTTVSIEQAEIIIFPDYTLCFRFQDLLNFGEDSPTIRQILDGTPTESDLISNCDVKRQSSYLTGSFDGAKCTGIFEIQKEIFREDVCYRLTYRNRSHIFHHHHLYTPQTHYNLLLRLYVGEKFAPTRETSAIVSPANDGKPYVSSGLSRRIRTNYGTASDRLYNDFYSAYSPYKLYHLPSPYETNCRSDAPEQGNECIAKCLLEITAQEHKLVPFNIFMSKKSKYSHLKHVNVTENQKYEEIFSSHYMHCKNNVCHWKSCYRSFTTTSTTSSYNAMHDKHKSSYIFSLATPSTPDTVIKSFPDFLLTEYVIYIMSCFGTWFGLSVIALNPLKALNIKTRYVMDKESNLFTTRYNSNNGLTTLHNSNLVCENISQ